MFFLYSGFAELAADLVEAAVAHCQLIVVSKWVPSLSNWKILKNLKGFFLDMTVICCKVICCWLDTKWVKSQHRFYVQCLALISELATSAMILYVDAAHKWSWMPNNLLWLLYLLLICELCLKEYTLLFSGLLRNCSRTYQERGWNQFWRSYATSMLCILFTNI